MSVDEECFVISPIGPEESEIRERADKLLDHVIKDALDGYGYETIRADDIDEPGQITTQVIQHTVNSELVIADLTNQNPNVFYELAIRHAAREPVIQIIEEGEEIPFDVHNQRTIHIDIEDLNSVQQAKEEIRQQVDSIEVEDTEINSPISMAMNLQFWEESGDPQQQELAEVIEMMTEMQSDITKIQSNLDKDGGPGGLSGPEVNDIRHMYEKTETMKNAIRDLKGFVEPVEFRSVDDKEDVENAIDYLDSSIRDINRKTDVLLKKYN